MNFVTNLPLASTSGGWGGISANIHMQMDKRGGANYVGPINPPYPLLPKVISKARRFVGSRGTFPLFDVKRLDAISAAYDKTRGASERFDLFHGATPWVHCNPPVAYGAYIDATFTMYLDIYSDRDAFEDGDVNRIVDKEGEWLLKADALFFGSDWVSHHAISEFGLDADKCHTLWVGGNVPLPEKDAFVGGKKFLFISLDFENKGGRLAVEALQRVRRDHPAAELHVLGQRPPPEIEAIDGVIYGGMLKKNDPGDLRKFCDHLATACGLVHPTSMDTMGAVLIEAGYFGCPSIATKRFGIPELVLDEKTGYLLDVPLSVEQISERMATLCRGGDSYLAMRRAARKHTLSNLTWDVFGARMYQIISSI